MIDDNDDNIVAAARNFLADYAIKEGEKEFPLCPTWNRAIAFNAARTLQQHEYLPLPDRIVHFVAANGGAPLNKVIEKFINVKGNSTNLPEVSGALMDLLGTGRLILDAERWLRVNW